MKATFDMLSLMTLRTNGRVDRHAEIPLGAD